MKKETREDIKIWSANMMLIASVGFGIAGFCVSPVGEVSSARCATTIEHCCACYRTMVSKPLNNVNIINMLSYSLPINNKYIIFAVSYKRAL